MYERYIYTNRRYICIKQYHTHTDIPRGDADHPEENTPHDQTDNSTFGELLVYLYIMILALLLLVRMYPYLRMLFNTFVLYDRLLVIIVYVPPYMLYSLFIITWYVPSYLYLGRGTPVTKKHLDLPTQLFSN